MSNPTLTYEEKMEQLRAEKELQDSRTEEAKARAEEAKARAEEAIAKAREVEAIAKAREVEAKARAIEAIANARGKAHDANKMAAEANKMAAEANKAANEADKVIFGEWSNRSFGDGTGSVPVPPVVGVTQTTFGMSNPTLTYEEKMELLRAEKELLHAQKDLQDSRNVEAIATAKTRVVEAIAKAREKAHEADKVSLVKAHEADKVIFGEWINRTFGDSKGSAPVPPVLGVSSATLSTATLSSSGSGNHETDGGRNDVGNVVFTLESFDLPPDYPLEELVLNFGNHFRKILSCVEAQVTNEPEKVALLLSAAVVWGIRTNKDSFKGVPKEVDRFTPMVKWLSRYIKDFPRTLDADKKPKQVVDWLANTFAPKYMAFLTMTPSLKVYVIVEGELREGIINSFEESTDKFTINGFEVASAKVVLHQTYASDPNFPLVFNVA